MTETIDIPILTDPATRLRELERERAEIHAELRQRRDDVLRAERADDWGLASRLRLTDEQPSLDRLAAIERELPLVQAELNAGRAEERRATLAELVPYLDEVAAAQSLLCGAVERLDLWTRDRRPGLRASRDLPSIDRALRPYWLRLSMAHVQSRADAARREIGTSNGVGDGIASRSGP